MGHVTPAMFRTKILQEKCPRFSLMGNCCTFRKHDSRELHQNSTFIRLLLSGDTQIWEQNGSFCNATMLHRSLNWSSPQSCTCRKSPLKHKTVHQCSCTQLPEPGKEALATRNYQLSNMYKFQPFAHGGPNEFSRGARGLLRGFDNLLPSKPKAARNRSFHLKHTGVSNCDDEAAQGLRLLLLASFLSAAVAAMKMSDSGMATAEIMLLLCSLLRCFPMISNEIYVFASMPAISSSKKYTNHDYIIIFDTCELLSPLFFCAFS